MSLSAFERFKNKLAVPVTQQGQNVDNSQNEAPGTSSGSSSSSSTVLANAAQPSKILQDVLDCIQSLKTTFDEDGTRVDDNNQTLHRFCAKLEFLLQTDMKDKKSITGRKKDYWEYFCECLAPLKGVNDGIKYVKTTGDCKTSLGKGRSFLRFCLMHHRLADSLQACCTNGKCTSAWYYPKSIWLQHDRSNIIISALYDLNDIIFDLAPRGYDLDNSWPSFARKNLEGQQSWSLSERARTMSITSLNSIGQDISVKGQFSSTPNDPSEMEHLAQELAISENVRSDLEDKMEAIQQQKQIFQQSVAESKGEVHMLENQLHDLQAEHKDLQTAHRDLEKRYDKMCVETEYKERDGKTQESAFETKITELQAENEKLLHKITQIEEDLELAQENLQITSSERDTVQNDVEVLKEKLVKLEGEMEEVKVETDHRKEQIEAEKIELVQKLKTAEELEDSSQRGLDDVQAELKEQTSLVVSLEKKVSALTTGYQWLNKLKEGNFFTEIPDLDATSSLTLRDVSYFVTGLQDKISTANQEKQNLNDQYDGLLAKHSELQQDLTRSKEKIMNLENSVVRTQENEETLKQRLEEFQGLANSDKDNLKQVNDDVIAKDKHILELKATFASLEQEKSQVTKELDRKITDFENLKKEIEANKEELNRVNEMTSMAVKNAQESMEKVKDLEQEIKNKDAKINDLLHKEKECELNLRSIEKQEELQCARLSDKDKEIENLVADVKKQSELNENLKQKFDQLRSEKDSAGLEVKTSKDKLIELEKKIEKSEEKISEEKQKFVILKTELETFKSEVSNKESELKHEKDTFVKELETSKNSNNFLEKDITLLKEKLDNQETVVEKLHESEKKLITKLETVEKELSSKALSVMSLEKDNDIRTKENTQLQDENKSMKTEIKILQDQNYEKQSESMLLHEKIQRSQDELERTRQFYETATKSESDWSDRFKALESNLSAKESRIMELTEVEKSLTVENSKLSRDKSDLEGSVDKLQNDLDYLKKGFKGKESQIDELRVIVGDADVEKQSLKRKLDDLSNQFEDKKTEIGKLQQEIENIFLEKNSIEESFREVQQKESNTDSENRQLEQNIFDMEQKRTILENTVEQMQKDFEEAVQEKEVLEEKVVDLEQESKENEKQIKELITEVDQVKKDKENVHVITLEKDEQLAQEKEHLKRLQVDFDVLSKDKYELEENVESLEKEIQEDTKELDEQRIVIGNLEKEGRDLKEKIRQFEESDMNNKNEIDSLISKQRELEKINDVLSAERDMETNKNIELQSDLKSVKGKLNELHEQNDAKDLKIKQLNESVEKQNVQFEQLELEKVEIERNFQKISDDVWVLQEKESNNVDAIKKLEEHIQKSELEKESIQGNLSLKCVEMNELQARFDDFQSENACLVQEYDLLQQTFNDLKETEEVVRSKLTEMTACRDEIAANLEQVKEQLKVSECHLQGLVCEKDSVLKEKEEISNDLSEVQNRCLGNETRCSQLENQITELSKVKDTIEEQLKKTLNDIDTKTSEIGTLQNQLVELNQNFSEKENEILLYTDKIHDLEGKCIAFEENEKLLSVEVENKESELVKLQHSLLAGEGTVSEMKEAVLNLEKQERKTENKLQEVLQQSAELEKAVNEKSQIVEEYEIKLNEIKDVVFELEADKNQLILDIKEQQQEKETLQTKDAGNLDKITDLKHEINEISEKKSDEIKKLEIEVDKIKETESSLQEALELSREEFRTLSGRTGTLEVANNEMKQLNETLLNDLEQIKTVKENLEAKCSQFEKAELEMKEKVKEITNDKETCETDLRQATAELELKKNELTKNLEDAMSDLHDIKVQLSNTSSELQSAHEEKLCIENMLHEANTKNNELEQKLECLNDQLLTDTEDLKLLLNEKEEEFQQFSEEIELLKRNVEEKENALKISEAEHQKTSDCIDDLRQQKDVVIAENSKLQEQFKEKDSVISTQIDTIDKLNDEKTSLIEQLREFEAANDAIDENKSELYNQVEELTNKVDELSKENYLYKEELERLEKTETDLIAQLTELTDKNKVYEKQCETLEKENESIKSNIDQEAEELRKMEEMLQETEKKLEGLEGENEKKNHDSEAEVDSLRQEITALEFQLSANQLEAEKTQTTGLDEGEFREMKDKVMEQETVIDQLHREMVELREVAQKYREQELKIENMQTEINSKDAENTALSDQLEDIQRDLREQMDSSISVKSTYDDQKVKTEELLIEKDEEINQLKEDVNEMKKKLVKLIRDKDTLWQKTDRLSFQQKLQASEKWMEDGKVTHCIGCNAEFSFTLRKHHCRLCGRIFCHTCSDNWVHTASSSKKSRACTSCIISYNEALREENGQDLNNDIEQSVEIPKRQILGSPLSSTASMASSAVPSDDDSVLETEASEGVSRKLVYDVAPEGDVATEMGSQQGATGGNETDEDKLKDSTGGPKSIVSDERGDNGDDKFHLISDEEIQRSFSISLSGDQTSPAPLDPYMSSSVCISLAELVRGEVNCKNEVWIKAGRSFAVPVMIDKPNTVFGWEFTSYPKDVVFSASYRSSQTVPFSEGQTLVPPCKCDSHKQVVKGELTAKQPGIYSLLFDNTYSKLTAKRINYTLLSDPPQDD